MGCGSSTSGEVPSYSNHGSMRDMNAPIQDGGPMSQELKNEEITMKPVDRDTVEEYLRLEKEISECEKNNPIKQLQIKTDQLDQLDERIENQTDHLSKLEQETLKEKADVDELEEPETKRLFMSQNIYDEKKAKEMQEYIDALNKQEIARAELNEMQTKRQEMRKEIMELAKKSDNLQELYQRQDKLLDHLFGGEYGSEKENLLEVELDDLEEQRGRILEAKFKWQQAQMMLEFACKQLAVAVQKWQSLPGIPQASLEIRYTVATDARNNLVAASQNIQGAQRYLPNVNFPYCTKEEVDTLNRATAYVFTDMQTQDRHAHAQDCYVTTQKRAAALLQWFDQVLNTTITRDLQEVNKQVREKTYELRKERVVLIKARVKDVFGEDVEVDMEAEMDPEDDDGMYDGEPNKNEVFGTDLDFTDVGEQPEQMALDELAPMPSSDEIFGQKVDELAAQHKEELENYKKEQELNQQRVNKDLQAKLNARRQRRARVKLEAKQQEVFSGGQ